MSLCDETYTFIKNEWEWKWYKKKLDVSRTMEHKHSETNPEKYPCLVNSHLLEYTRSPDECTHYFVYQVEKSCPECAHKVLNWPEMVDVSNKKDMDEYFSRL